MRSGRDEMGRILNVCADKSGGSTTQTASTEANSVSSTILVNIDKAKQRMTVFLDVAKRYDWPVSTGQRGYSTPSGSFIASSMNERWYSKQWDNAARGSDLQYALLNLPGALVSRVALTSDAAVERGDS